MHKLQLTLIGFLLTASTLMGQTGTDSTYIDVRINGLSAGLMRLVGVFGDQNYLADSAQVQPDGHFILRREHPLAEGFYTFLLPGQKNFAILIGTEQHFSIDAELSNLYGSINVKGATDPQLFYETQRYQSGQDLELNKTTTIMRTNSADSPEYKQAKDRQIQLMNDRKAYLQSVYDTHPNSFFTKFKIAGQNPDVVEFRKPNGDIDTTRQLMHYREHFWDGVDFTDDRLLHTPVISNKLRRYIKDLTPQNPDSIIKVADPLIQRVLPHREYFKFFSNWIALQYENGKTSVMDGEAVYVHIIDKFITPETAFWDTPDNIEKLRKHAWEMEASLLGKKGPDVRALDVNDQYKSIYEITAPIIVVFMYSPHCEHCQEQAPEIIDISKRWKSKGVEFFGIGVNTDTDEWKAFVKKMGFPFINVYDPSNRAIYAKYYVDNTPELYVLNKDRTIIAKNLHANQLETVFERELKKYK